MEKKSCSIDFSAVFWGRQGRNLEWLTFICYFNKRCYLSSNFDFEIQRFYMQQDISDASRFWKTTWKWFGYLLLLQVMSENSAKHLCNIGSSCTGNPFPEFSGVFSLPIFWYKNRALKSILYWPGCITIALLLKSIVNFENLAWTYFCCIPHFLFLVTLPCQHTKTLRWPSFTLQTQILSEFQRQDKILLDIYLVQWSHKQNMDVIHFMICDGALLLNMVQSSYHSAV